MNAVVLDTSVIVAGLISRQGAASALVGAFFAERLAVAYSDAILREYADVLGRPVFADAIKPADRVGVILKLRANGVLVKPSTVPAATWPDLDDLPFVAAALSTASKVIVARNPRDFAPATAFGLRVMSPAEAHRELL